MIWKRLKNDAYIRKIQNSVKPLMMPSQKLHLQELDMIASLKEKEPSLPSRHLMRFGELKNGYKTQA